MEQISIDFPKARVSDPITSHKAALSQKPTLLDKQAQVFEAVRSVSPPGCTDEMLTLIMEYRFRWPENKSTARSRRKELTDKGLIVDSGRRETLSSGRKAIIWVVASQVGREK